MNNQIQKEYDVAITFYEKIISQFRADLSYYAALIRATKPKNILELGCGSGRLFPTFIQEGVENITGIDISDEMILKAKTKHPSLNVNQGDILDFKSQEKFDLIVISNSLLKHIETSENRIKILENAKLHLSERGVISIDHSPYLYYVSETSDWYKAESSVIAEWIPNKNEILKGYQWRKEVIDNQDVAKWRHFENGVTNFEVQFSTYVYTIQELIQHIDGISLNYVQVMTDYFPKGILPNGNRFISILGIRPDVLNEYNERIQQELKLL
jgi:2-polyprenyl-3-methyl-5-hydroxy-6-metoxy-1,4-benzoquinol methylase